MRTDENGRILFIFQSRSSKTCYHSYLNSNKQDQDTMPDYKARFVQL